jgi:poly(3-hydroxybutyrate) depolymerase
MTDPLREAYERQFPSYSDGSPYSEGYWKVWQAAYAQGVSDAAECCEQWAEQHRIDAAEDRAETCDYRIAAESCAAAIRKLVEDK